MNKKFLFSFLLLTFSVVNFLEAQNMWEEFHLTPQINNHQFIGKYVWLGYDDGAIRIDTTNWNYEYFNFTAKPEMMLSSGITGNITSPNPYKIMGHNGEVVFFQNQRALHYDGNNFMEEIFPSPQLSEFETPYIDSSGTIWKFNGICYYLQGGSWQSSDYTPMAIDTNECLIAEDTWNGGYFKICGLNNVDTFISPLTNYINWYGLVIDSRNNQWAFSADSMKLYKFDGVNLTTWSNLIFPNGDTPNAFIPINDHSALFTYFYSSTNYVSPKIAYYFNGTNYIELDTSVFQFNPFNGEGVQYFVSPSGRIFALESDNYDSWKLFSTINGANWQFHPLSEIQLNSQNQAYVMSRDSLNNLFSLQDNQIIKFGANWSEQICPLIIPDIAYQSITSSANGICWIEKNIDSVTQKIYRWDPLTNQVDSFPNITSQPNMGYSIVAANDNKVWLYSWDTIAEYDGTTLFNKCSVPSLGTNSWWNQYYADNFRMINGNALYNHIFFSNYDSGHLYQFENGLATDMCIGGIPKLTSWALEKDHQNNLWGASKTALYKWNGLIWDSIPLPFILNTAYAYYDPVICFNDADELFIVEHEVSNYLASHLYKYNGTGWTEFPIPTPITYGQNLFSKDGFLWTFNGQSLLRFDQNGFPNTLGSTYIVNGKAYHDLNANNIQNTNESGKQNVLIQSSSGDFSFTQYYGNYLLLSDSGQNTITCTPPLYYTVTPASVTVNNTGANPVVDSVDFALQPLPGMNDLSVDVTHYPFITWNTNPGISYWVTVKNPGTTVQSATLTFNVPDTLVIAYVYPTPTSTNGNQLTWSLNNLAIDTSLQFYITASFQLPTPIGSTLIATADVQSANTDLTPANNIDTVSYLVTGPYDPNMKLVDPMGEGALGITDTTHHVFTYTIYFQNTGNDTAVNVRVDDFLDADFDWTSFNLISSSSPVDFDLNQNGLLRFFFNTIFLPDSNVNEPMSHGFVKYSVRLKSGPSLGKQLTNAASIYFDYQPAIFTNSTLNSIGIATGIGVMSYNSNDVLLFPNPSDGLVNVLSNGNSIKFISVYDLSGRLCYSQEARTDHTTLNIQSLAQGLYLVKIKLQNGATELKKLAKE